ncbi:hypothetical protein LOAG_09709 [Loa loa]|uniref:SCP domain-containing protein n=1 Tax=Loa loa TaxID=7209 RepID=A0A1S0TRD1_LOALO|nr:hypothetical protein LOAG_09709 [Loa loa]EFO18788.1 hypothetical protein LOAG_09709 [Loa loa]
MHFQHFAILAFIVISSNITSATMMNSLNFQVEQLWMNPALTKRNIGTKFRYPKNKLVSAFKQGNPEMSEYANHELSRRYKILRYRDDKTTPPYLKKAWNSSLQRISPIWGHAAFFVPLNKYKIIIY